MAGVSRERRAQERVTTALSVFLGIAKGVTRDVSATGVFFESTVALDIGSTVDFSVEFGTPGGRMMIHCNGKVVRREERGDGVGVAVRVTNSKMEMAASASAASKNVASGGGT